MARFGRRAARQRLRKATQQALSIPAFRTPVDCTPWVLGGLWPAELNQVTAETATLATYLRNDLNRIADSANDRLRELAEAGLPEPIRQAEEARVVNVARAFAVLRVESTIRHLRREPVGFVPPHLSLGPGTEEPTRVVPAAPAAGPQPRRVAEEPPTVITAPRPRRVAEEPTVVVMATPPPTHTASSAMPEGITDSVVVEPASDDAEPTGAVELPEAPAPTPEPAPPPTATPTATSVTAPTAAPVNGHEPTSVESAEQRLRRLLQFVARQEPGLGWVVADRSDGTTVLATDLAYGWVPPGIDLPAGVEVLPPGRRRGGLAGVVGPADRIVTYRPGDAFPRIAEQDVTTPSNDARTLTEVTDLGWRLTEATQWRDGLPRMTHTMAKAGASGTGVVDAEVDVLRVHVDTARYQVLAQYPDVNDRLLGTCLLLAATEALVTGDRIAANYHFAWFLELTSSDGSGWQVTEGTSRNPG
ncbi:DUF5631 domain-containing protein [Mycobacterium sp. ACS4331]|uniref:DUF5631 domain-containing protein n=1 Tax=Mycobacterium sp. ACS4331 TaxID=1834121 RepID=UPI0008019C5E|nr:DUF5631 domain-containing protein [Mycobacterium sp. ACS4331]OBF25933.1 hypothetical protein A5727_03810 [Mycobacterium sp. ACS4331]